MLEDVQNIPDGLELIDQGELGVDKRCELLDEIGMLQGMAYADLKVLAVHMSAFKAPPGICLFREGDKSNWMCFLVKGSLVVHKEDAQGNARELTTIRSGKTVGEMSLLDNFPHSATVTTQTEALVLLFSRAGLERLHTEHPRVAFELLMKIAQLLSFRLRHASGRLVDTI